MLDDLSIDRELRHFTCETGGCSKSEEPLVYARIPFGVGSPSTSFCWFLGIIVLAALGVHAILTVDSQVERAIFLMLLPLWIPLPVHAFISLYYSWHLYGHALTIERQGLVWEERQGPSVIPYNTIKRVGVLRNVLGLEFLGIELMTLDPVLAVPADESELFGLIVLRLAQLLDWYHSVLPRVLKRELGPLLKPSALVELDYRLGRLQREVKVVLESNLKTYGFHLLLGRERLGNVHMVKLARLIEEVRTAGRTAGRTACRKQDSLVIRWRCPHIGRRMIEAALGTVAFFSLILAIGEWFHGLSRPTEGLGFICVAIASLLIMIGLAKDYAIFMICYTLVAAAAIYSIVRIVVLSV